MTDNAAEKSDDSSISAFMEEVCKENNLTPELYYSSTDILTLSLKVPTLGFKTQSGFFRDLLHIMAVGRYTLSRVDAIESEDWVDLDGVSVSDREVAEVIRTTLEMGKRTYNSPVSLGSTYIPNLFENAFRYLSRRNGFMDVSKEDLEAKLSEEQIHPQLFKRMLGEDYVGDFEDILVSLRRKALIEAPPARDRKTLRTFSDYKVDIQDAHFVQITISLEYRKLQELCIDFYYTRTLDYHRDLRDGMDKNRALSEHMEGREEGATFEDVTASDEELQLWHEEIRKIYEFFTFPAPITDQEKKEIMDKFPDTDRKMLDAPGYEIIRLSPALAQYPAPAGIAPVMAQVYLEQMVHKRKYLHKAQCQLDTFYESKDVAGLLSLLGNLIPLSTLCSDKDFRQIVSLYKKAVPRIKTNGGKADIKEAVVNIASVIFANCHRNSETYQPLKTLGCRYVSDLSEDDGRADLERSFY